LAQILPHGNYQTVLLKDIRQTIEKRLLFKQNVLIQRTKTQQCKKWKTSVTEAPELLSLLLGSAMISEYVKSLLLHYGVNSPSVSFGRAIFIHPV
jgi:hypothetical protein